MNESFAPGIHSRLSTSGRTYPKPDSRKTGERQEIVSAGHK